MTSADRTRRKVLLGTPALLFGAAACRTESRAAARPLSAEQDRSLATLRLVDPRLPLFSMTLYGPYDPMRKVVTATPTEPWGCSLFLAGKGPRGPLFGRNFDWRPNPALLLRTQPPRGPASISMVDISYLGIDQSGARRLLTDRTLRRTLLQAVAMPFDGMNAHGLAVGMAAVPSAEPPRLPGRPVVTSGRIQRLVLDQARTVDEAVEVFRRYTVSFSDGGTPLHYLLADARGRAAAVEFVDGHMQVLPDAGTWHDLVNFVLSGASETAKRADDRYRKIADRLRATGGRLDPGGAMDLLAAVAQHHTRWSAVYELRHGGVHVSLIRDYSRRHDFRIPA